MNRTQHLRACYVKRRTPQTLTMPRKRRPMWFWLAAPFIVLLSMLAALISVHGHD